MKRKRAPRERFFCFATRVALVWNFQVFFPSSADKPINQHVLGITYCIIHIYISLSLSIRPDIRARRLSRRFFRSRLARGVRGVAQRRREFGEIFINVCSETSLVRLSVTARSDLSTGHWSTVRQSEAPQVSPCVHCFGPAPASGAKRQTRALSTVMSQY